MVPYKVQFYKINYTSEFSLCKLMCIYMYVT